MKEMKITMNIPTWNVHIPIYSAFFDDGTKATALSARSIYRLAEGLCRHEQRNGIGRPGYVLFKDDKAYYYNPGVGKIASSVKEALGEGFSNCLRREALYQGIRLQESWTVGRLLILLNAGVFHGEDESNLSAFFWRRLAPRLAEFIKLTPYIREVLNNLAKTDVV